MPPKDESPITLGMGTLYIKDDATGETTPVGQISSIDHATIIPEPASPEPVYWINPNETFTFHLYERKMSRKRFVKMLMARGYGRNFANSIARIAASDRSSYRTNYNLIALYGVLPRSLAALKKKEEFTTRYMGKWHYEEE